MPTVSVIIPAYNSATFIEVTLLSVMAQSFTDYEVIVVNDGSPDTEEFERAIEPFREHITYLVQANAGAAAARNRGLREAHGRYVAFLDADDLWRPECLMEQLAFIEQGEYEMVYCDAMMFGEPPDAGHRFMALRRSYGPVTFMSLIDQTCNVITSGVLARRDTIFSAGLFNEKILSAHDFELWLRMARHGARMAYQRQVLLSYRVHIGSLSCDAVSRMERELAVYHEVLDTYDLTPVEATAVAKKIAGLKVALNRETGKRHLLRGEVREARSALAKAQHLQPSLKLWMTLRLLHVSPCAATLIARRRAMWG